MTCAKFSWNWPSGSGEEDFYSAIISPWKRVWPFILTKSLFKSPSPKNDLCQVWLKLAQWFLRRRWKCESLQTDDGQQAIRKAQLSFQLRWAKKRQNYKKISKFILKLARMRYESISSSTHYKTIQSWDNFANNVHE